MSYVTPTIRHLRNKGFLKFCNPLIKDVFDLVDIEYEILYIEENAIEVTEYYDEPPHYRKNRLDIQQFVFQVLKTAYELGINLKWKGFKHDKYYREFELKGLL